MDAGVSIPWSDLSNLEYEAIIAIKTGANKKEQENIEV